MPEGMDYGGFVMPYADSPLDGENVGESVYLDILGRSRRFEHITTPYLILDDTTLAALKIAAKRGVEVIIIMPHIPDKLYAYLLARSYYAELLRAGVQIYEYTPLQVKQAVVGYGRADKKQVMDMVRRILSLQAVPKPDDAADAVAIARCHARSATSLIHQQERFDPCSTT